MKTMIHFCSVKVLFIIGFLFFCTSNNEAQTLTLDFPSGVEVCGDDTVLDVIILNDTGGNINNGTITLDLSLATGLEYIGLGAQNAGPTISEDTPGVPVFSFNGNLMDNDAIDFQIKIGADCSVASSDIIVAFEYQVMGNPVVVTETLTGFSIAGPDIDIVSSAPNGISGVIGYEFEITNTVENNGTSDADSVFYCVEDNANADLLGVEIGGVALAVAPSSTAGYTCYVITNLPQGGSVAVVEEWVITTCDAPQDLFRRASFGCDGSIDCAMEPDSDFPETVLTLVAPTDPISITTANATELYVCGASDMVCITIENSNGDDYVTRNVKAALSTLDGVEFDYSTITMKTGDPVTHIAGTDSILIGELTDGEIVSFTIELSVVCGVTESAIDYTVDVVYDELCEGVNNMATETSAQISVLGAEFSILSPLITGNLRSDNVYDAILGIQDTIKVPMVNAGSGSIDEFTYWVVNPSSVTNIDVLINGNSLIQSGTSGDTVFYTITSADIMSDHTTGGGSGNGDGSLDENESLVICEVWEGIECDLGTPDPIRRAAQYGCGGVDVCSQSNMSTTGIDYGFATPDLTYSVYDPLIVRPACWSEEYNLGRTGYQDWFRYCKRYSD